MTKLGNIPARVLTITLIATVFACPAAAQMFVPREPVRPASEIPESYKNVDIDQNLDTQLPLDAVFVDATGKTVTLGDYFTGEKPVILALVYHNCPAMCGLILNGTLAALQEIPPTAGEDFEVVVISFNHEEGPELSAAKKKAYTAEYKRPGGEAGWHFLTGDKENIARVCDKVGFKFYWNEQTMEYVHASAIYVNTPSGRISRYLFGVYYEPDSVRLALTEASRGKIGTLADKLRLLCSHFDPDSGTYNASAMKIMRLGAPLLGGMMLGGLMVGLVWARKKKLQSAEASVAQGNEAAQADES